MKNKMVAMLLILLFFLVAFGYCYFFSITGSLSYKTLIFNTFTKHCPVIFSCYSPVIFLISSCYFSCYSPDIFPVI